jgi:hypothetical protein
VAHKGHSVCEFTSKAACEKARRVAIGQCSSMLDENRQCDHWGIGTVDGKGYCGQHLNSVHLAAIEARRAKIMRDESDARIDAALAWHSEHPSVHEPMPLLPQ